MLQIYDEATSDAYATLCFTPDGSGVYGATDYRVKLYDVRSGEPVPGFVLPDNLVDWQKKITAFAASPDGSTLFTAREDGKSVLWDKVSATQLRDLTVSGFQVTGAVFSPDGSRLATSSSALRRPVRVWSVGDHESPLILRSTATNTLAMAFSADSRLLAVAGSEDQVAIWDLQDAANPLLIPAAVVGISDLSFSSDGSELFVAGLAGVIRVFSATTGLLLREANGFHCYEYTPFSTPYGGRFSPDRKLFVMAEAGLGTLWDLRTLTQSSSLRVDIAPPSAVFAGAQWRVNGSETWFESGTTLPGLEPGHYTVEFQAVPNLAVPAAQQVEIAAGELRRIELTYAAVSTSGKVRVSITPPEAVAAGARWRIGGAAHDPWRNSGEVASDLTPGSYTIAYSEVSGWVTPASEQIELQAGETEQVTATYTSAGLGLQVTIGPEEVVEAGALWRIVGSEDWHASGHAETGLARGVYAVEFSDVSGWVTPAPVAATLEASSPVFLQVMYVQPPLIRSAAFTQGKLKLTVDAPGYSEGRLRLHSTASLAGEAVWQVHEEAVFQFNEHGPVEILVSTAADTGFYRLQVVQ